LFKKISLDNYKSFRHIEIDLSKTDKDPLPYAFVYGENGSGKSNLIESMMFLKDTMNTMKIINGIHKMETEIENQNAKLRSDVRRNKARNQKIKSFSMVQEDLLDAVSELIEKIPADVMSIVEIIRMIDSAEGVSMACSFVLEGRCGNYQMRFGQDNRLIYEKLSFTVESRTQDIFELCAVEKENNEPASCGLSYKFSPNLFKNKTYGKTITDAVQKYWGKHSFMAIMNDQFSSNNAQYMENSLGTKIKDVIDFFNEIVVSCNYTGQSFGTGINEKIMTMLKSGKIPINEKPMLLVYEKALNSFFTRIFSDIKKVYYKTESNGRELSYVLFFSKMIGGKIREVSIYIESTGTEKLLNLFPAFFECAKGKTVFFDEIDSGIHDILIKEVIAEVIKSFKGQFIVTTHNTSLLQIIDPQCTFVIQTDPRGEKRIISINKIERTQSNNNNQNRYLNGVFDGIPIIGEIDFKNIVYTAEEGFGVTK